jgi:hypothetical protein
MTTKDTDSNATAETQGATLSRRQILTAGLAAAGAGLTNVRAADAGDAPGRTIGVAAIGSTAVEFRMRLAQNGENFIAYGYLSRAQNAGDEELFSAPAQNETTALITAYASGALTRRVLDQSVHSLDIEGTLTIYHRAVPGASFGDPSSFQFGTPVATFDATIQDMLSVFAPGKGLPTLNGDLRQTAAGKLDGPGGAMFGHVGAGARLFATGLGALIDPVTLTASFEMAGNWTTK